MRRLIPIGMATALAVALPFPAGSAPRDFRVDTIGKLDFATGLQFTPSGRDLYVNEKDGRIRIIRDGKLQRRAFASIETSSVQEGGLLGLALHPRFEDGEPWVYAFYTLPDGSADRVIRLRSDGERATDRETVIDEMPAFDQVYHHGGILAFGPDGKLYVTNGEAHRRNRAQDPNVLGGKIYRVNPDGSIPEDNPFEGELTWSYGHRNPFGLAFDPETGNLWSSENGPTDHDEVNRIVRRGNYGWPVVRGNANDDRFRDPAVDYEKIVVPTMMAFAGDAFPEEYRGDLFLGAYAQGTIRRLRLTKDRDDVTDDDVFHREDAVVGMTWGPDGLYFTTPTAVRRIRARVAQTPEPSPTLSPRPSPTDRSTARPTTTKGPPIGLWVGIGAVAGLALLFAIRAARRR